MKAAVKSLLRALGLRKEEERSKALAAEVTALFDLMMNRLGSTDAPGQLKQDAFALLCNGFKRDGFFVEFGAADGIGHSNTYALERDFGWTGILAEPSRNWHDALKANRSCHIETDCVWKETGATLQFDMVEAGFLSTLSDFSQSDHHAERRAEKQTYPVKTISLNDLLRKFDAPAQIDYMSVDTEGSELEILKGFDFSRHRFNCVTIEHNFTPAREALYALMTSAGYRRVFPEISRWDDWYVPV